MRNLDIRSSTASLLTYHWLIVLASGLTILVSLGLGRFSFGMIIHDMSVSLSLSYSQVGLISSSNFVGFFFAVLCSPYLNKRLGQRLCIVAGLLMVVLGMTMMSFGDDYYWLLSWYSMSGFGSGLASLTVTILISNWFQQGVRGRASSYITMGSSLGIVISGIVVPEISDSFFGWRMTWLFMSGLSLIILIFVATWVKNYPKEIGLAPKGKDSTGLARTPTLYDQNPKKSWFLKLGLCYGLFGAGYMTYSTFIVTALISNGGFTNGSAGLLWALIGVLSFLSGPVFGAMADKWGIRISMAAAFGGYALSYLLAGLQNFSLAIYASIFFFGICAWSVPAIMGAAIPGYAKTSELAKKLSLLTLFSSFGQALGPMVSGIAVEMQNSFIYIFWFVGAISALGVMVALLLPEPRHCHS